MADDSLTVFEDATALARGAAEWLCERASASSGRFSVALSGGSTPKPVYEALARSPLAERMPWTRINWFWGDERCVPFDHPDSNYRMVYEALLARVPVPAENIHPIRSEGRTPREAADDYARALQGFYSLEQLEPVRPLFDVCLLGLGDDGHTASLLPGQPVLEERERWVAEVPHGRAEARITLTYPAIEHSRCVLFLVSGATKREALRRARAGDAELPAARVRPIGTALWFADRAAAGA